MQGQRVRAALQICLVAHLPCYRLLLLRLVFLADALTQTATLLLWLLATTLLLTTALLLTTSLLLLLLLPVGGATLSVAVAVLLAATLVGATAALHHATVAIAVAVAIAIAIADAVAIVAIVAVANSVAAPHHAAAVAIANSVAVAIAAAALLLTRTTTATTIDALLTRRVVATAIAAAAVVVAVAVLHIAVLLRLLGLLLDVIGGGGRALLRLLLQRLHLTHLDAGHLVAGHVAVDDHVAVVAHNLLIVLALARIVGLAGLDATDAALVLDLVDVARLGDEPGHLQWLRVLHLQRGLELLWLLQLLLLSGSCLLRCGLWLCWRLDADWHQMLLLHGRRIDDHQWLGGLALRFGCTCWLRRGAEQRRCRWTQLVACWKVAGVEVGGWNSCLVVRVRVQEERSKKFTAHQCEAADQQGQDQEQLLQLHRLRSAYDR